MPHVTIPLEIMAVSVTQDFVVMVIVSSLKRILDYTCILILPIETDHLDRYVKILIAVTVMLFVLIQLEAMTVSAMMAMKELASTARVCHNGFV